MSLTFVLGGARSGKTRHALAQADQLAAEGGGRRVLLATAQALDEEMAARIARHQAERGPDWTTLEIPLALPQAVAGLQPRDVAVIDCLTLWLSNLMHAEAEIAEETEALVAALHASPADAVILISNEVGQGIVPDNPLARRFRDEAGWMHQAIAGAVDRMVVVQAGLPLVLKG
ncbi:bifunctional adenosylcobinamide kinase/adenosylcobinamide-phosphate guanylyltransferase [Phenylobacterium aquaticum]|uniref:bifunctional adenosylcobinamide kinase/adenosylcobinamide-phosphate guanylyltransferase n=1 Tax=Phenylobacterium aquaticum TaxID=1763816 RepID=UPI0026EF4083|nr:bifunctional adenosylcobinamide kinase/adenosylcobinamide-phosphate guanylyltransferase [Phenylobacterium aquaticum]